ncbi:MAG: preprotein translocase subunit SecA [Acutalibacteraceae bacterium]
MSIFKKLFGNYSERELKRVQPICDQVLALEDKYSAMTDSELREQTNVLKGRLADGETLDDILPDAYAVCREAGWRVLGMKHFPVQIIGGIILHQGRIAEMKTGEGKTLVATLPSYLNALSGKGVHVVTVNDYLAKRDSEWMGKIHRFLGLSVGLILHDMKNDERREAYACDITYGTNNELGFDYLRDNMVIYKEQKVQRGHNFAVVDEVDSILIDEARTPLIISGQGDKSTALYTTVNDFAKKLSFVKIAEVDEKEEHDDKYGDADYIVDEKAKTATLTPKGIARAEKVFGIDNLMDNSPEAITILHHINQAIKAHGVMTRDIDYVVQDEKVLIVDEFTGRIMYGRRYNEGLHQAIEAKEGVKVERESKTLASITFQNYFRLYSKLSGMTGTALTEETEFNEIYKLDCVEIPTNRPTIRKDLPDRIYSTAKGKYNAVIERIIEAHNNGQPVLVGTISIDKSEMLGEALKRKGIKHSVLNAKYHEKEAEIVAQAGKYGAVTIATNMAGRGTDILLGGNPEFMAKNEMRKQGYSEELIEESTAYSDTDDEEIIEARQKFADLKAKFKKETDAEAEKVREAGGLVIIGTERHESRRIDNQLRGRAGRQGDPGESRFYLSLEDDLMRIFGGEKLQAMMNTLNIDEDTPIEAKMVSRQIEGAQAKVEGRNFSIRKNVLRYDDVMNRQREIIYSQRDKVLDGENIRDNILKMIDDSIASNVDLYLGAEDKDNWNFEGLRTNYINLLTTEDDFNYPTEELDTVDKQDIIDELTSRAHALYEKREAEFGDKIARELDRVVMLRVVDTLWMDHIDAMEELKQGIGLRSFGQKDPAVAYTIEGFDMFDEMIAQIKEDTARQILTVQVRTKEEPKREQIQKPMEPDADSESMPARAGKKIGRNSPCPCGSGKKYKQCCGKGKC